MGHHSALVEHNPVEADNRPVVEDSCLAVGSPAADFAADSHSAAAGSRFALVVDSYPSALAAVAHKALF